MKSPGRNPRFLIRDLVKMCMPINHIHSPQVPPLHITLSEPPGGISSAAERLGGLLLENPDILEKVVQPQKHCHMSVMPAGVHQHHRFWRYSHYFFQLTLPAPAIHPCRDRRQYKGPGNVPRCLQVHRMLQFFLASIPSSPSIFQDSFLGVILFQN